MRKTDSSCMTKRVGRYILGESLAKSLNGLIWGWKNRVRTMITPRLSLCIDTTSQERVRRICFQVRKPSSTGLGTLSSKLWRDP